MEESCLEKGGDWASDKRSSGHWLSNFRTLALAKITLESSRSCFAVYLEPASTLVAVDSTWAVWLSPK